MRDRVLRIRYLGHGDRKLAPLNKMAYNYDKMNVGGGGQVGERRGSSHARDTRSVDLYRSVVKSGYKRPLERMLVLFDNIKKKD
jgi:hypothetical protein